MKNEPYSIEWYGKNNIYSSSTHAEMKLIISYLCRNKKIGKRKIYYNEKINHLPNILFVISVYKGKLRNSRPCNTCIKVMKMYNIKKVIYSTGNKVKPFQIEIIESMPFIKESRGNINQ